MVRTIIKPFLVLNEIDSLPPLFRHHIRPRKACRENTLTIIYKYKAQRILSVITNLIKKVEVRGVEPRSEKAVLHISTSLVTD